MLLAWASPELRQMCASADGLEMHWPHSVETAKELLSAVMHAQDLRSLTRLRSIGVRPLDRSNLAHAAVVVQFEEVEMRASVLTKTGERIRLVSTAHFWKRAGSEPALLVEELAAAGRRLARAVS